MPRGKRPSSYRDYAASSKYDCRRRFQHRYDEELYDFDRLNNENVCNDVCSDNDRPSSPSSNADSHRSFQSHSSMEADSEHEELPENNRNAADDAEDTQEQNNFHRFDWEPDINLEEDEESVDDNNDHYHDENADYLYEGAPITAEESAISILSFALRHNLSDACLADLLKLIDIHCKQPNGCKTTLHMFKKFFNDNTMEITRRYYCTGCNEQLDNAASVCAACPGTETQYFVELSVIAALQQLLMRPGFQASLDNPLRRQKHNDDNYEDIYDGAVYKEHSRPGQILSEANSISFTWYTDGIAMYKSSNFSIWPIFLTINELPVHQRYLKENTIMAGIWFGSKKPEPSLFLKNLGSEMETLEAGVDFEVYGKADHVNVKAKIIMGIMDLPAKALMLEMCGHTSFHGCQKCTILAVTYGKKRVYPYQRILENRTQDQTDKFAEQAVKDGKPFKGVKGPSAARKFSRNYIRSTTIDAMHCVYLGVVKLILTLLLSPTFSDEPWSLSQYAEIISQQICSIRPPQFVKRLPRTISNHLSYLKASEIKYIFHYYLLPITYDFLPGRYLEHLKLLLIGIHLLSQESISEAEVDRAGIFLNEFVARFQDLYGKTHMTCNLHHLLHLAETVRDFGPLWVSSAFPYEDLNGKFKHMVNGTRFAQLQIISRASMVMQLEELKEKLLIPNSAPHVFCRELKSKRRKNMNFICTSTYTVGQLTVSQGLPYELQRSLNQLFNDNIKRIFIFSRILKDNIIYSSTSYTKNKQTNSTFVKYVDPADPAAINGGIVQYFIKVVFCNCHNDECNGCDDRYMAVIREFQLSRAFFSLFNQSIPNIFLCTEKGNNAEVVININLLSSLMFVIKNARTEQIFVVDRLNAIESE